MTKLVPISAKKLIKILGKLGFTMIRQNGSHCFFRNDNNGLTTVVPIHSNEDVSVGLLKKILNDIDLKSENFDKLR